MRTRAGFTGALVIALMLAGTSGPAGGFAQAAPRAHSAPPENMRVDINRASLEELLKIPGLTRSWAGRIVRFRPYRSKVDLLDRGIVSGAVYSRIKDYIIAHREKQ